MKASNFIVYLASLFLLFRTIYITLTKFSTPPLIPSSHPASFFLIPLLLEIQQYLFIYLFIYLSFFVTKQLVIIILTNRL